MTPTIRAASPPAPRATTVYRPSWGTSASRIVGRLSPTPTRPQPVSPRWARSSKYTAWWERWNEPTLMWTTDGTSARRSYRGMATPRAAWRWSVAARSGIMSRAPGRYGAAADAVRLQQLRGPLLRQPAGPPCGARRALPAGAARVDRRPRPRGDVPGGRRDRRLPLGRGRRRPGGRRRGRRQHAHRRRLGQ